MAAARLTVGIGGLGAIGWQVAAALDAGIPGLELAAVAARGEVRAEGRVPGLARPVPVMPAEALAEAADVVVECAPAAVFDRIARPAVAAGRLLMVLSCGQLLDRPELVEQAAATGARILVPSGALLGLDAVRAAAEGGIESVTMMTRKPPGGLAGAPYVEQNGIDLQAVTEPKLIFSGSAREAVRGFPANVNVAVALSLAGIGADRTTIEIWADPTVTRNTHRIRVEATAARFELAIENVPSEENPRTGKLTPLSVIAALRGLASPLRVGT